MKTTVRSLFPASFAYMGFVLAASVNVALAAPEPEEFLIAAYQMPYDYETEMTDIIVVNALLTDTAKISRTAKRIIQEFESHPSDAAGAISLREIFAGLEISTNNANIQMFRERTFGPLYRVDVAFPLATFADIEWKNGGLTNDNMFFKAEIHNPPTGDNPNWVSYSVQDAHNHVAVDQSPTSLRYHEGFYLDLYGLPRMLRFNALLQTAEMPAERVGDPTYFRVYRPSPKRMAAVLNGSPRFGSWSSCDLGNDVAVVRHLDPEGADRGAMRVYTRDTDLNRRHLAYLRDPDGGVIKALFAWEYGESGKPVRFLKATRPPDKKSMRLWAQKIVYVNKTANVDLSLFQVDLSKYTSIFDKRLDPPVQTINGVVVGVATELEGAGPTPGLEHRRKQAYRLFLLLFISIPIALAGIARFRKQKGSSVK